MMMIKKFVTRFGRDKNGSVNFSLCLIGKNAGGLGRGKNNSRNKDK